MYIQNLPLCPYNSYCQGYADDSHDCLRSMANNLKFYNYFRRVNQSIRYKYQYQTNFMIKIRFLEFFKRKN